MSTLIINNIDLIDQDVAPVIDNIDMAPDVLESVDVILYQEGHNTTIIKSKNI